MPNRCEKCAAREEGRLLREWLHGLHVERQDQLDAEQEWLADQGHPTNATHLMVLPIADAGAVVSSDALGVRVLRTPA